jgi:hypothetical protein
MTPSELLDQAAASAFGLALSVTDAEAARRFRRQLYSAREAARRSGDKRFDSLSVLVRNSSGGPEVWIVRHEALPGSIPPQVTAYRDLSLFEVPRTIGVRGPSRLGLMESAMMTGAVVSGFMAGLPPTAAEREQAEAHVAAALRKRTL